MPFTGLAGQLDLPKGLTHVGKSAFEGCINLSRPSMPAVGNTTVGPDAFRRCKPAGKSVLPRSMLTGSAGPHSPQNASNSSPDRAATRQPVAIRLMIPPRETHANAARITRQYGARTPATPPPSPSRCGAPAADAYMATLLASPCQFCANRRGAMSASPKGTHCPYDSSHATSASHIARGREPYTPEYPHTNGNAASPYTEDPCATGPTTPTPTPTPSTPTPRTLTPRIPTTQLPTPTPAVYTAPTTPPILMPLALTPKTPTSRTPMPQTPTPGNPMPQNNMLQSPTPTISARATTCVRQHATRMAAHIVTAATPVHVGPRHSRTLQRSTSTPSGPPATT